MTAKVSDDIRQELAQHPGGPVTIEDAHTQARYIVIAEDRFEHIQRLAYDDSDLSPNEMLAAAQNAYNQDTSGMEVYGTYQPNP